MFQALYSLGAMDAHRHTKRDRKATTTDLLHQHNNEGEDLLSQTVTRDETWVHHFAPES